MEATTILTWGDVVTEYANEGADTVLSTVNWVLGANVENLRLTGTGAINGTGNALDNVITGNSAANILSGGAGSDRFVFASMLSSLTGDTINDFSVADGDSLALDDAVFTQLAGKASLANHFRLSNQAAVGDDDYIVYNPSTGQLSYDSSGNGTGTANVFATLSNKPQDLTAAQFAVI